MILGNCYIKDESILTIGHRNKKACLFIEGKNFEIDSTELEFGTAILELEKRM